MTRCISFYLQKEKGDVWSRQPNYDGRDHTGTCWKEDQALGGAAGMADLNGLGVRWRNEDASYGDGNPLEAAFKGADKALAHDVFKTLIKNYPAIPWLAEASTAGDESHTAVKRTVCTRLMPREGSS